MKIKQYKNNSNLVNCEICGKESRWRSIDGKCWNCLIKEVKERDEILKEDKNYFTQLKSEKDIFSKSFVYDGEEDE